MFLECVQATYFLMLALGVCCVFFRNPSPLMTLHELAYHEDYACGSQEEPHINRTTEGNTRAEPGLGQAVQEEVAKTKESRA